MSGFRTSDPTRRLRDRQEHPLEGLVATLRYSWLQQDGSPQTATQLRAYINYAVKF
jgi:hypothetical protein